MLSIIDLTCRFGSRTLFSSARFQLNPGRRYGLVGANGSGKSSLLKILSEESEPVSGSFSYPNDWVLGTLKQEHFAYENIPILDTVIMGKQALWEALQKKEQLLKCQDFSEADCHQLEELEHEIQRLGGYEAHSQAAKILEGLGISQHAFPMHTLSGGYKLRVLLAQTLFTQPDILLLDEPTNHLDIFSIQWLEEYLTNYAGVLLFTSHDRKFLNSICTDILDLDHQKITPYRGNYEAFLEKKLQDQELKAAHLDKQEKKKQEIQGFIDRFRSKASKARQAQSKMHLVKKLEEEMGELNLAPSSRRFLRIKFQEKHKSASLLLKAEKLQKSYRDKAVLSNVSFEVFRQERIAFIGPNGIGKSTLLNILVNSTSKDSGIVKWGASTEIAYFPQDHSKEVSGEGTIFQWLAKQDPTASENTLRDLLGRVLFTQDEVKKTLAVLSGGERARLILAKMMLLPHNILIFDEPTNHLDMEATESLIEALQNYKGTLLLVSHNRDFIERIANRIIEITPTGTRDYPGTYQEYLQKCNLDYLAPQKVSKSTASEKQTRIESYKENRQRQRQIASLEKKCTQLEEKINAIDVKFAAPNFYQEASQEEIQSLLTRKNQLQEQLEEAFNQLCEL